MADTTPGEDVRRLSWRAEVRISELMMAMKVTPPIVRGLLDRNSETIHRITDLQIGLDAASKMAEKATDAFVIEKFADMLHEAVTVMQDDKENPRWRPRAIGPLAQLKAAERGDAILDRLHMKKSPKQAIAEV